jgi:hypothetical protein
MDSDEAEYEHQSVKLRQAAPRNMEAQKTAPWSHGVKLRKAPHRRRMSHEVEQKVSYNNEGGYNSKGSYRKANYNSQTSYNSEENTSALDIDRSSNTVVGQRPWEQRSNLKKSGRQHTGSPQRPWDHGVGLRDTPTEMKTTTADKKPAWMQNRLKQPSFRSRRRMSHELAAEPKATEAGATGEDSDSDETDASPLHSSRSLSNMTHQRVVV